MAENIFFELKRKFIHVFALLFLAIYIVVNLRYGHVLGLFTLTIILVLFLIIDFIRIKSKRKIPIFHIFWRKKESTRLGGQVYFIIGTIIALAIFDFRIAVVAVGMTVFGDMAAALVGKGIGSHWIKSIPDRNWEGVIAEFVVDVLIGFTLLTNVWIIIGMALAATVVETLFTFADDNLTIPVFAGLVGQILLMLL